MPASSPVRLMRDDDTQDNTLDEIAGLLTEILFELRAANSTNEYVSDTGYNQGGE